MLAWHLVDRDAAEEPPRGLAEPGGAHCVHGAGVGELDRLVLAARTLDDLVVHRLGAVGAASPEKGVRTRPGERAVGPVALEHMDGAVDLGRGRQRRCALHEQHEVGIGLPSLPQGVEHVEHGRLRRGVVAGDCQRAIHDLGARPHRDLGDRRVVGGDENPVDHARGKRGTDRAHH